MRKKSVFKTVFLGSALVVALGYQTAFADGDTSTESAAIVASVQSSKAVVIRVPINSYGQENASEADLRVTTGAADAANTAALPNLWESGTSMENAPVLTDDTSTSSYTSTYWGWSPWRTGQGWYDPYYYRSYHPSFYYGGYSYNYYNPYSFDYYYGPYGYRYYYYPRWGW